jgi:O-antigen/teichoic acid export membrane protein
VPTALGAALLPSLARLAHAAPGEFRAMQTRVLSLLVVLGLPVMIAVMLLAAPLCHLLYGPDKFTALPPVLQVYALAILPMYIVTTMYQFLVAQGRQLIWSLFLLATVGLYVLFSVLLIPWTLHTLHNGTVGAVGATFLAEMCSAGFALALLGTNLLDWQTLGRIGRALLATAGMGVVLWLTRGLFLLIPLMAGTLTFIVLGGWLHILTPEEHDRLVGMVRRKLRRR